MSAQKQGIVGSIGIGTCPCHKTPVSFTTIITEGASTTFVEGMPAAFVGSIGISTCGHITIATTGASSTFVEGKAPHRINDLGQNCGQYILTTGANTVITGK